jgi:cation:H+ antiporter
VSLSLAVALVLVGLLLLTGGGELLVRGAVAIARHAGLTPAVIGLTIVALGTSLPELVVSVIAGLRGQPDIAIGNVVGSNICNVALILGVSALMAPLPIRGSVVRLEWPVMFLTTVGVILVARDGAIDRLEAGTFLVALAMFVSWSVWIARREVEETEATQLAANVELHALHTRRHEVALSVVAVLAGLVLLTLGGRVLVDGAVRLAQLAGVTERVIGLTVVAVGTSAPELATSIVAAYRRQTEVAVANIIGSNIFNLLGILGVGGVILPLHVSPAMLASDVWWMLGTSAILFPMMRLGMRLTRVNGAVLVAGYVAYLWLLVR